MTLHDAIEKVLLQHKRPMPASEIAAEVNKKGLYQRGDLQPVPSSQIHARVKNYPSMFKKEDGLISLASYSKQELNSLLAEIKLSLRYKTTPHYGLTIILLIFFKWKSDNPGNDLQYNKEVFFSFLKDIFAQKKIPVSFSQIYFLHLKEENLVDHYGIFNRIGNYTFSAKSASDNEMQEFFENLVGLLFAQKFMQGQFITPASLAELISKISGLQEFTNVYNPAAGINTLAIELNKTRKNFHFTGEDIEALIFLIAYVNLEIHGVKADDFHLTDSFERDLDYVSPDLIVSIPPYGVKKDKHIKIEPFSETRDLTLAFIQKILIDSIKYRSRAIIVIPESFLTNNALPFLETKKHIAEKKLLEGVISLPSGIFQPYSAIQTCILIINAQRTTDYPYFIDADHNSYFVNEGGGIINILPERVFPLIQSAFESQLTPDKPYMVNEADSTYGKKNSLLKSVQNLGTDFSVRRKIWKENMRDSLEDMIELNEVLHPVTRQKANESNPFLRVKDLNKIQQDTSFLPEKVLERKTEGFLLKNDALLITRTGENLLPTKFIFQGFPVNISHNILAFNIKAGCQDKFSYDYLVEEMGKEYFKKEVDIFVSGAVIRTLNQRDFLNLMIKLPSEDKSPKVSYRNETQLTKAEESPEEKIPDIIIYKFIKHELGNISGSVKNNVSSIKSYLLKNDISLDKTLDDRTGSPTLGTLFEWINDGLNDIDRLSESIRTLTKTNKQNLNLQITDIYNCFLEELENAMNNYKQVSYYMGINNDFTRRQKIEINTDPELFKIFIRNFIMNTVRHGRNSTEEGLSIVINFRMEEDFLLVDLINSGIPFPKTFDFAEFIVFGSRAGKNKGTGLGGFLMQRIAGLLDMDFDMLRKTGTMEIDNYHQRIQIPTNVHFTLKIDRYE